MRIKGWRRSNKDLGTNRIVYSNEYNNSWIGIGKNPDKSWSVMTPKGVQRSPFPNKTQALTYAYAYMRRNPNG